MYVLTINPGYFPDVVNIWLTTYISIGNNRDAHTIFNYADGIIVNWLTTLFFCATMDRYPGSSTLLCSLAQFHRLSACKMIL